MAQLGSNSENASVLDLARLTRWFDENLEQERTGPLWAELLAGGRSNLTYVIGDGESRWVLRRPPLGHVLKTAHDMAREYRVISALRQSDVPVPDTYGMCHDIDMLGAPFYVMEYIEGTAYRTAGELTALGPQRTRAISEDFVAMLATLHRVVPAEVGLQDLGKPSGYLARQVDRWHRQFEQSASRTIAGMDELHLGLIARTPKISNPGTVVHGDYRIDNVLVGPTDTVAAVVDWEMATLGDPLADLALMVLYQRIDSMDRDRGEPAAASRAPGWLSEPDVLEKYRALTGSELKGFSFYVALAAYKMAVIREGIHFRFSQGETVGAGFEHVGDLVEPLVRIGLSELEGGR